MAHKSVEVLLGKLVTDESLRHRFKADRPGAIKDLGVFGLEFTPVEIEALCSTDLEACEQFATSLDPRLKKSPMGDWRRRP